MSMLIVRKKDRISVGHGVLDDVRIGGNGRGRVTVWRIALTLLVVFFLVRSAPSTHAGVPPEPSRTLPAAVALFPSLTQLGLGLVLLETGERTEAEIAASFPDPADAAAILHTADWAFNAYRIYVARPGSGPETPARIEISLHQFSSAGGAAYALPYFVHGRAVVLGRQEVPPWDLSSPCAGAVLADREATRYQRIGDLLVRVTVIASDELTPSEGYIASLSTANSITEVMIANAGSSWQQLNQTCQ